MNRYVCRYRIEDQEQTVEVEARNQIEAMMKGINHLNFPKDRKRFTIHPLGCEVVE